MCRASSHTVRTYNRPPEKTWCILKQTQHEVQHATLAAGLGRSLDSGPDAGAAHSHVFREGLQAVPLPILAGLPLEEHFALVDGCGVVVVGLHRFAVLEDDAAGAQALSLHVGVREMLHIGDFSAKKKGEEVSEQHLQDVEGE